MKDKNIVKQQKVREKAGNEHSYDGYVARAAHNESGDAIESVQANPDGLAEGQQVWGDTAVTKPQQIMAEAIEHLQGRQKEVYYLIMREKMSELEVAELMGITQQAVNTYKMRAIKFITTYCQNAIAKGEKE